MAENRTSYQPPYQSLDVPLNPAPLSSEYSSLHTLYPGEPMINRDTGFDRYYIPHCDPEGARCSFKERRENTIESARRLEMLARKGSGEPKDRVTIRAVEDPSMIVEDPALSQLSTQSPVALNDGMHYSFRTDLEDELTPNHSQEIKREAFGPIPDQTTDKQLLVNAKYERTYMIYVLIFIGFIILCLLLAGVFLRPRR